MIPIRISAFLATALLFAPVVFGQECEELQNAKEQELISYLKGVSPDQSNTECITWSINKLGSLAYEPSISVLTRFIDFRRAPIGREKVGLYLHAQGIWELFPATNALSRMGKSALPAVLSVIKTDSSSVTARQNAVFVWMEVYRQSDDHPQGVALLRREEIGTKDNAIKERLKSAVSTALTWCNPPEEAACRRAAGISTH